MNKAYILFLLFVLVGGGLSAQTLAEAKALYGKGEYEKAKPAFKRFVKSQPGNGNYNLWYGVCCLKTDQPEEALKYLETAVKKRIPSGQLYLGQNYHALYRYEEAIETYEAYISDLTKRKRDTGEAEALLAQSKACLRMLKGVEQVCIVDSFVTDKADFLKAYRLSPESGQLFTYGEYFPESDLTGGTVYETELGNKIYYSEWQTDSTLNILSSNKLLDKWSTGKPLPGSINEAVNANYPYVLSDGITIYYAADGAQSMGGYDIFVTRYNTNNDTYLAPENVGMPFNSPYNDYMYVIDEFNNLGWFASDRYQPEGKVCIYVFIPNASKQVYNYEGMDHEQLVRLARLLSIRDTWTDPEAVKEAQGRLANALNKHPKAEKKGYEFDFIINDRYTYHRLEDFRSAEAKARYEHYAQLEEGYRQLAQKLEDLRQQYAQADKNKQQSMTVSILDLEKRVLELSAQVEQAAIQVRNLEIQNLK